MTILVLTLQFISIPAVAPLVVALLGIGSTIAGAAGSALLQTAKTVGLSFALIGFLLMLRVLFMLAKAYIAIMLLVIFAPIMIAFGAATGGGIKSWFTNLLANILVFPFVGIIMVIGSIILDKVGTSTTGDIWNAPLLGGNRGIIGGVLALGILLIIPEIDGFVKQLLNVRGPSVDFSSVTSTFQKVPGELAKGFAGGGAGGAGQLGTRAREATGQGGMTKP